MTTPKKAPKAMLHNYFYSPLPGSIKITQLCKIAAQPDAPNATAHALRTCFIFALATKKLPEKTSRKY